MFFRLESLSCYRGRDSRTFLSSGGFRERRYVARGLAAERRQVPVFVAIRISEQALLRPISDFAGAQVRVFLITAGTSENSAILGPRLIVPGAETRADRGMTTEASRLRLIVREALQRATNLARNFARLGLKDKITTKLIKT